MVAENWDQIAKLSYLAVRRKYGFFSSRFLLTTFQNLVLKHRVELTTVPDLLRLSMVF